MRVFYFLILLVLLGATAIFALQNQGLVTLRYLNRSVDCPLSLLIAIDYFVGMLTGWTVVGLIRRSPRPGFRTSTADFSPVKERITPIRRQRAAGRRRMTPPANSGGVRNEFLGPQTPKSCPRHHRRCRKHPPSPVRRSACEASE